MMRSDRDLGVACAVVGVIIAAAFVCLVGAALIP